MTERPKREGTPTGVVAVGVDFTPASDAALDRAKQLAKATHSPLLLVHVVSEHSVVQVVRPGEWTSSSVIPAATPEGKAALKAASVLAEQRLDSGMHGIDS